MVSATSPRASLRYFFQVFRRRTVEDGTEFVEPRPVAGAVPGRRRGVPGDDASQVRADGGSFVDLSALVSEHGQLATALDDDGAGVRRDLIDRRHFPGRQP